MPFARQSVHDPLKEETSSPKSRLPRSSIVYHEETKPPQPIARPRINIDLTQIPTLAPEPSPVLSNPLQKRLPKPQIQAKLTIGRQNDKYEQEADTKAAQEVKQINTPASTQSQEGQSVLGREVPEEEEIQAKQEITSRQRKEAFAGGEASADFGFQELAKARVSGREGEPSEKTYALGNQKDEKRTKTKSAQIQRAVAVLDVNEEGYITKSIVERTDVTSLLRGGQMGRHTTAQAVIVAGIRRCLKEGTDLDAAIEELDRIADILLQLPGTKLVEKLDEEQKKIYEESYERVQKWQEKKIEECTVLEKELIALQLANALLIFSNVIPLTNISGGSTSQGEADASAVLETFKEEKVVYKYLDNGNLNKIGRNALSWFKSIDDQAVLATAVLMLFDVKALDDVMKQEWVYQKERERHEPEEEIPGTARFGGLPPWRRRDVSLFESFQVQEEDRAKTAAMMIEQHLGRISASYGANIKHFITYKGIDKCLKAWLKAFDITSYQMIYKEWEKITQIK